MKMPKRTHLELMPGYEGSHSENAEAFNQDNMVFIVPSKRYDENYSILFNSEMPVKLLIVTTLIFSCF